MWIAHLRSKERYSAVSKKKMPKAKGKGLWTSSWMTFIKAGFKLCWDTGKQV